jgi:cholesterol transport system auxiliary component
MRADGHRFALRPPETSRSTEPVPATSASLRILGLLGILAVAGCGSSGSPPATFDLTLPPGKSSSTPGRQQIVINDPSALQPLDSDRVLVSSGPSISYLGGAQWSDRLPRLVQARIVQTFENTGRTVGRPGNGVSADFQVDSDIRAFGISTAESPQAVVEISAKIINAKDGRIVAARVFRATTPVAAVSGKDAPPAIDQAATKVFGELVRWVSSRV